MSEHNQASHLQITESSSIITAIRQAKKNPGHVNVELNGRFWINVDKDELIRYDLFKGKQITHEQRLSLEEVARDNKLMEKVINFISLRPRSIKEIKDYLIYRRELEPEKAQQIILDLQKRNFLSDQRFTRWYLENRLANGVHGVNKAKAELAQKGVAQQIIDTEIRELQQGDDFQDQTQQKIKSYIEKISRQIKFKDKYDFKRKLIVRLQSRGFTYEQIQSALKATPEHSD